MGWRNHMPNNQIMMAFGNSTDLTAVGPAAFQEQLYKSMIGQALDMKREMEEAQMKAIKEEWANDPERREVRFKE